MRWHLSMPSRSILAMKDAMRHTMKEICLTMKICLTMTKKNGM